MIQRYHLPAILLLAVVVRVAVLLLFPQVFDFVATGAIHGSDAYDAYALNLLETGVYGRSAGEPDAAIPPLYSYALAVVYGLFGRGYLQVGLFHTLLDVLSIWMLYEIGRRLLSVPVAALAALFTALYPYLIFQNLTLIDTPFFIFWLHAFVLVMVLLRARAKLDRGTWLLAALGGVVLGLSMLARPILPPLALLVALWFLFRLSFWQTVARLLPVALIGAAVLVPWIMRNYAVFDAFVPMTTTSGANFWQGNSPYTIPVFRAGYDVQWTAPEVTAEDRSSREADAERFQLAFEFLRENPDKILELLWVKTLVHWSIDIAPRYNPNPGERLVLNDAGQLVIVNQDDDPLLTFGENDPVSIYDEPLFDQVGRLIHTIYWGGLFLLGLAGVVLSARLWREVSLLWFVQISMTLVYVFFHPSTRYRVPSDPLYFLFSAFALVWAGGWVKMRAGGRSVQFTYIDRENIQ